MFTKKIVFIIGGGLLITSCSQLSVRKNSSADTLRAKADLIAPKGSPLKGQILFTEKDSKLTVTSSVDGIKQGPHGFHIHEVGDCSAADFSSAKGHFNPDQTAHGSHHSSPRHPGDLGNLIADEKDSVRSSITVEGVTLGMGPKSIIGRSVVIHENEDDLKSQPAGNSGPRIACGIIESISSN